MPVEGMPEDCLACREKEMQTRFTPVSAGHWPLSKRFTLANGHLKTMRRRIAKGWPQQKRNHFRETTCAGHFRNYTNNTNHLSQSPCVEIIGSGLMFAKGHDRQIRKNIY